MLERVLEYLISQGPAWVVAGVVVFISWKLFEHYKKREAEQDAATATRLKADEDRFMKMVDDSESRLVQVQDRMMKQQETYIESWIKMTTESLAIQGRFTTELETLRGEICGNMGKADTQQEIMNLLKAHDGRLRSLSKRLGVEGLGNAAD